jgi:hypothetical protein
LFTIRLVFVVQLPQEIELLILASQ